MKPYWQSECGGYTIFLGDCLEVLPTLEKVDAVVTDPPYGIYLKGGKWGKKFALQWDREPGNGVVIHEIISRWPTAAVWGGNYFLLPPSRGWLVWHKLGAAASMADVELCWTSLDINARLVSLPKIGCVPNIHEGEHPTQKPVRLMTWTLSFFPNANSILDPFCGSGTTLVAAAKTGRRAIGIEISEEYCAIAKRRLEEALMVGSLFDPKKQASLFGDAP